MSVTKISTLYKTNTRLIITHQTITQSHTHNQTEADQLVYNLIPLADTVQGVSSQVELFDPRLTSTFSKIIYTV